MICINNKYGFIKLTNFYQINYNFSYFSTKPSRITDSILNWGVVRLPILHTVTRYLYSQSCQFSPRYSLALKCTRKLVLFYSQLVPIFTNISSITLYYLPEKPIMKFVTPRDFGKNRSSASIACRTGWLNLALRMRQQKQGHVSQHGRYDKDPSLQKAISAMQKPRFCSPSSLNVTSSYE